MIWLLKAVPHTFPPPKAPGPPGVVDRSMSIAIAIPSSAQWYALKSFVTGFQYRSVGPPGAAGLGPPRCIAVTTAGPPASWLVWFDASSSVSCGFFPPNGRLHVLNAPGWGPPWNANAIAALSSAATAAVSATTSKRRGG